MKFLLDPTSRYALKHFATSDWYLDAYEDESHDFAAVTRQDQNSDTQLWSLKPIGRVRSGSRTRPLSHTGRSFLRLSRVLSGR